MPVYVKKKTEDEMNAKLNLTRTAIGTLALLCAVPAGFKTAPYMGLFAFPAQRVLMFDNGRVSLYKDMKVASNG